MKASELIAMTQIENLTMARFKIILLITDAHSHLHRVDVRLFRPRR
jgi:hypothetical protein